MDIINTDIVKSAQDIFWQEMPDYGILSAKPVLVLSAPFAAGGPEEEQLNGILRSGCQLTEGQYNVLQLQAGEQVAWHKLRETLQPKVVLLFNVIPSQLGIASLFRLNEINRFDSSFWVPTFSLAQVIEDKNVKGNLWNNALKPLFVGKVHGTLV